MLNTINIIQTKQKRTEVSLSSITYNGKPNCEPAFSSFVNETKRK